MPSILRTETPGKTIRFEWAEIPICPGYLASNDGHISSESFTTSGGRVYKPFELKQQLNNGYFWVRTRFGNKRVNRLVCEAFHGPPPSDRHEAAHLDCNRSNNRECNLEWQTSAKNQSHPVTQARFKATWGSVSHEKRSEVYERISASHKQRIASMTPEQKRGMSQNARDAIQQQRTQRLRLFCANKLIAIRQSLDLSRSQFAELIGHSYITLYSRETGRRIPSINSFYHVVDVLGISPHELLSEGQDY